METKKTFAIRFERTLTTSWGKKIEMRQKRGRQPTQGRKQKKTLNNLDIFVSVFWLLFLALTESVSGIAWKCIDIGIILCAILRLASLINKHRRRSVDEEGPSCDKYGTTSMHIVRTTAARCSHMNELVSKRISDIIIYGGACYRNFPIECDMFTQ